MRKLLAFYLLIIDIENAFAQAAIEYDVYEDARENGADFFQNIIGLIVFFGLAWIIIKIVESYSNAKKEREERKRMDKIQNMENIVNGHEYVNLGLSVNWATCNVGAKKPSDYGGYFAWGEIEPKSEYTKENCETYGKKMRSIAGDPTYDTARANWGSPWRMPTKEEMDELISNCTWEWVINGYKVTGPNRHSIFIPATGRRGGTWLICVSKNGYYWSATPDEDNPNSAYCRNFDSDILCKDWGDRYWGLSIRPIIDK